MEPHYGGRRASAAEESDLHSSLWCGYAPVANAIFEYRKIFHNRQRRHTSLGMLTPVEFEAHHQPTTAA